MIKVIYIIDRDEGDLTGPMRQMLSCLAADPRILLDIRDCRRPGGSRDAFLEGLLDEPNVRLSRHAGSSMSFCCNSALEAGGEADWIQFLQAGTSYDVDQLLQELQERSRPDAAEELGGLLSLVPVQRTGEKEQDILLFSERNCRVCLPEKSRRYWNPVLDAFVIRPELIGGIRFDPVHEREADFFFLMQLMEKAAGYDLTDIPCVICRYPMTDAESYRPAFDKNWYDEVEKRFIPFLQKAPSSRLRQSGLLYLCDRKLFANRNNSHKEILDELEVIFFFQRLKDLLSLMDDEMIVQGCLEPAPRSYRVLCLFLLKLKYGNRTCREEIGEDGTVYVRPEGGERTCVGHTDQIRFQVDAINYEDGRLLIDGELTDVQWAAQQRIGVELKCGEEWLTAQYTGIYRFEYLFGRAIWRGHMVQAVLEEKQLSAGGFAFFAVIGGQRIPCAKLLFPRIHSRLNTKADGKYWTFGKRLLTLDPARGKNAVRIMPASLLTKLQMELKFLRRIRDPYYRNLRIRYWMMRPFIRMSRRPRWISYDQLYKCGDNGEYFYRYVREHHGSEVKMYYLLNEDVAENDPVWRRQKSLLYAHAKAGRARRRMHLAALNADIIFSTRASVDSFFELHDAKARNAVGDLYKAKVVCIQHGLTVQNIAQYQNRLFDNLRHYFCASPMEIDNICRPVYGFTEDMVSLTGVPRYDGLAGEAEKKILIAPTWRRNLTDGPNQKGVKYSYVDIFKKSEYYRVYNSLISDNRLTQCARRNGYRIVMILHPNIGAQAPDFDGSDVVSVISGVDADYEEMMKTSALMVTDYSGIQYDFAYMRRPVLYYRPESLPPQYVEGFHSEDMQLGPVYTGQQELVAALCRMMESGCHVDQETLKKINRFFPMKDREGCRRIYEKARSL